MFLKVLVFFFVCTILSLIHCGCGLQNLKMGIGFSKILFVWPKLKWQYNDIAISDVKGKYSVVIIFVTYSRVPCAWYIFPSKPPHSLNICDPPWENSRSTKKKNNLQTFSMGLLNLKAMCAASWCYISLLTFVIYAIDI